MASAFINSAIGFSVIGGVIGAAGGFGAYAATQAIKRSRAQKYQEIAHDIVQEIQETEEIESNDQKHIQKIALNPVKVESMEPKPREKEIPKPLNQYEQSMQQSSRILESTFLMKQDTVLMEHFSTVGKFMLFNPVAFSKAVEMVDKLFDLQILIHDPGIPPRIGYKHKAFRYKSDASEALLQLQKDTCDTLKRTIIQIPELNDNIQWIRDKLESMVGNMAKDISVRLDG